MQNKNQKEQQVKIEIDDYFACARQQKCPKSMKQNLYAQITKQSQRSWLSRISTPLVTAGLTLAFVSVLLFNTPNKSLEEIDLTQAKVDLQIAMHYINQVSLKSLSSVNSNGIRPGLIQPLARTYAAL